MLAFYLMPYMVLKFPPLHDCCSRNKCIYQGMLVLYNYPISEPTCGLAQLCSRIYVCMHVQYRKEI